MRQYVYAVVEVARVVDGDTFWLRLDVGFRQWQLTDIRLDGWDCPEIRGPSEYERQEAQSAKELATSFLTGPEWQGMDLWVATQPDPDNFGRWLGQVWREGGDRPIADLGVLLSDQGLATRWPTRWREVYGNQGGA